MWKGIYNAMEVTKNKKSILLNITDNKTGKIYNQPEEICKHFAEYFEHVPLNVRNKIPTTVPSFKNYLPQSAKQSMYFKETDPAEVLNFINKLKDNCSTGDIDIPNQFLKIIGFPLSYLISYIANRSILSGYMPNILKVGKQTPIFKSGENWFSNYRPITVVNSISKIIEKLVGDRLISYLETFELLNKNQFGFRKKHSTIHAMINLLDTCLNSLDQKLTVGGVFLDISKAFDCVDHNILFDKLKNYGIRGNILEWFKSYLSNRELYVSVDGEVSSNYKLSYGVPQGSVLGPVLFLLYINDIINSSNKFHFSMFADDTALILKIDRESYDETIRLELLKVMKWFDANMLLLNVDKTKYLYFGPHYNIIHTLQSCVPEYLYKKTIAVNVDIVENNEVKYLGVVFDNKLKFDKQIRGTTMKLSRMVGILWKCRDLPIAAKLTIYHSLVASYLNYGILIWGSELAKNVAGKYPLDHVPHQLSQLNVAHNKIIRAITCSKKYDKKSKTITHTAPLLKKLNLLNLNDIYYLQLALFAFDCIITNNLPSSLSDYITNVKNVYNTRACEHDAVVVQSNLEGTCKTIKIASAYLWNLIPIEIRKTNYSRHTFKSKVRNWLISMYDN